MTVPGGSSSSGSPSKLQRVLITTDTVGGIWNYTLELARSLEALGIQPYVAAMGDLSARALRELSPLERGRLFSLSCRLEWMQSPWQDIERANRWLIELARTLRPDIVHLNSYACAAQEWPAPVLVVGHSCVYSWYQAVKGRLPGPRWRTYHNAVARGLRSASGVTAPTRSMLALLQSIYGTFRALPVIPNGRRAGEYPPANKQPLILSAGRLWDEAKNISSLADMAVELSWPVVLAGEPHHPEGGLRRFENVRLLGVIGSRELAAWYAQASIYVLPALYEPFGLTALEAGLAGCALVLGDIESLRETWEGAALFVPPRRPELLKQALNRLAADAGLLRYYARKARQRALSYSAERMGRGYVRLYRSVLAGAQASPRKRRVPASRAYAMKMAASGRKQITTERP
jgi:glycogen synthase